MKSFAKQVVLTWLRSEKMDIHGRHATFAINQCIEEHTLSETCKAFARRIYYIMSREKQRYAAYVLHYLQMGANVREASSHAIDQCCTDLYALDFYVPWENLCAQVKYKLIFYFIMTKKYFFISRDIRSSWLELERNANFYLC